MPVLTGRKRDFWSTILSLGDKYFTCNDLQRIEPGDEVLLAFGATANVGGTDATRTANSEKGSAGLVTQALRPFCEPMLKIRPASLSKIARAAETFPFRRPAPTPASIDPWPPDHPRHSAVAYKSGVPFQDLRTSATFRGVP
jgi:hypothetical protein